MRTFAGSTDTTFCNFSLAFHARVICAGCEWLSCLTHDFCAAAIAASPTTTDLVLASTTAPSNWRIYQEKHRNLRQIFLVIRCWSKIYFVLLHQNKSQAGFGLNFQFAPLFAPRHNPSCARYFPFYFSFCLRSRYRKQLFHTL